MDSRKLPASVTKENHILQKLVWLMAEKQLITPDEKIRLAELLRGRQL